jgi:hypothetical protein
MPVMTQFIFYLSVTRTSPQCPASWQHLNPQAPSQACRQVAGPAHPDMIEDTVYRTVYLQFRYRLGIMMSSTFDVRLIIRVEDFDIAYPGLSTTSTRISTRTRKVTVAGGTFDIEVKASGYY